MLAKDLMTQPVITIGKDDLIKDAVEALLTYNISGLPVVDARGHLVGILSESDLVISDGQSQVHHPLLSEIIKLLTHEDVKSAEECLTEQVSAMSGEKVEEYMTAPALSLPLGASLEEVAALICDRDINRVPIVDEERRAVGIISRHDLLKGLYGQKTDAHKQG